MTAESAAQPVAKDKALRLSVAAALAYPDKSMTVSSLRKERNAGRLETWIMAGKEFTSLAAIEEMERQCRAQRKVPASGSSPPSSEKPGKFSTIPSGSSGTDSESLALAAALMRCQPPKTPSDDTSSKSTILPLRQGPVRRSADRRYRRALPRPARGEAGPPAGAAQQDGARSEMVGHEALFGREAQHVRSLRQVPRR